MKLFTIGFTGKSAEGFFSILTKNKVKKVIDIRLSHNGLYEGFTKSRDLPFFLDKIAGIDYCYLENGAPTKELKTKFGDGKISWMEYKKDYWNLLKERNIAGDITKKMLNRACLLCSEVEPDHCHRKVFAEYCAKKFGDIEIIHLS